MKVSIEVDERLIAAIDRAADVQKISRNAAFKEALETWIAYQPTTEQRSLDYSKLEFDPDFIPFEVDRPGLEAFLSVPNGST